MSTFVKHEPCPKCGSKNNLGRYSDGSAWCFGCGYYEKPTLDAQLQEFVKGVDKSSKVCRSLPEDAETAFPKIVLDWLGKYSLTSEEVRDNNFLYSPYKKLLIFPVYEDNVNRSNLLMWQGRYFGDNAQYPKYVTYGAKNLLHIIDRNSNLDSFSSPDVVLVEDLISAIKVGRVKPALPLWGSTIPLEHARRLCRLFSNLTVWLDKDKEIEALKQASKLSPLFDSVKVISTELDPKCYDTEQIKEQLNVKI